MLSETLSQDRAKQNDQRISILVLGNQVPSLSPALASKDIGKEQTEASGDENDPWARSCVRFITKGDLVTTQHGATLLMSNPATLTQQRVIQNTIAQFPCQSIFWVGHLEFSQHNFSVLWTAVSLNLTDSICLLEQTQSMPLAAFHPISLISDTLMLYWFRTSCPQVVSVSKGGQLIKGSKGKNSTILSGSKV